MANTENIEAKLCAYVDGELDPAGRAEIEAHLVSNPQHRQLMDELMRQRELIAGLPRERAPEDLFEAMTNQLERSVLLDGDAGGMGAGSAGAGPAVAGRINQWPQVFAAAAVLLLAVGLAAVIYFVLPAQNQPDYARVTPPPAGAPSVASPGVSGDLTARTRTLSGSDAGTRPIELADRGAAADRVESKSGPAAKAGPSDVDTLAGVGAVAVTAPAPTALAAGPAPTLPPAAAAPATPEAPSLDPFSKSAFQAKPGASAPGLGVNVTNMFADAQINEKLKAAPGVPDNSMVVVVNAGNPSIANQQIQEYFANNGIKWEPVAEPMPAPLDLKQTQTVHGTRLADTRMRLKGGPPPAANDLDGMSGGFGGASATGSGGGAVGGAGGAGQQGERDAAKEQREQSQSVAQDEPAQRRMKDDSAAALAEQPQQDKQFADQSKLSRPAVLPPYPARKDAPDAPPAAVDAAQRRADGGDIGAAPSGTSTGAGAKAGKMPADLAPTEAESAQQSPTRDQVAPPESQHAQQQAAAAAPRMEQQGQQQQELALQQAGQPHKQLQQQPQQPPAAMQQQLNMEPGQQGQQSQTHQVFIARGLTKQQVLAMNTAIANGNRIANYSRAGDTITPATLPSVDQTFRLDPPLAAAPPSADALAKKEGESAHAYSRATEPEPTTQPTGGALAMTTQPTTTATLDRAWDEESKRLATTTAAVATTTPSTAPATAQAAAPLADAAGGAEDLVDVVILVQPEADPTAAEQIQQPQQQVAPNAAGVDVPSPAETPTPSTAPLEPGVTATSPASAPTPAPASAPR